MDGREFEIKVTGERDFGTGAQRDPNEDKGRFDLLSPIFLKRLAQHTQKGGKARGDRNWEQGMPTGVTLDSAIRHIYSFIEGNRDEDHLAAAAWNIMVTIHVLEMIDRGLMHDELNNLPNYLPEDLPGNPEEDQTAISEEYSRITAAYDALSTQTTPAPPPAVRIKKSCENCDLAIYEHPDPRLDSMCWQCARGSHWKPIKEESLWEKIKEEY